MACGASILVIISFIVRLVISAAIQIESLPTPSIVRRGWDCSAYYGKPLLEHCQDALDQIPNTNTQIFFVSQPVDAPIGDPIQQMPKYWHSRIGDCTISVRSAVDDEPDGENRDHDTDSWRHIKTTARRITASCVSGEQVGGFRTAGEYSDLIVYVYALDSTYAQLPPQTQAETLAMQMSTGQDTTEDDGTTSWTSMDELSPEREMQPGDDSSDDGLEFARNMRWHSPCGEAVYCVEESDCCKGQRCANEALRKVLSAVVMFGMTNLANVGRSGFCTA